MRLLQALPPLVFLLLLLAASTSKASVLEGACKSYAASHPDVVSGYDFCVKFFQTDKGSAAADKRGLAAIAVKIIRVGAESVAKRIAALQASEKDVNKLSGLSTCAELYSEAMDDIGDAAKAIASGAFDDAVSELSAVLDAPVTCEDGFAEGDKPSPSPLAAEDAEFGKEAAIALSVTADLAPINT
ncbi:hypothetical protein ACP70R_010203 [Stipagrostis hirtigluma subsp. patula]